MSRSIPSTVSRILFAACGLALISLAAPIQAQTVVTTAKFSLTYPGSDWQKVPVVPDTTGAAVFNVDNEAGSFLVGAPHTGGDLTQEQIKAAMMTYGATDSMTLISEGDKALGGKTFSFVEFKPAVPEEGNENQRFRVYFHTQGSFLFQAILIFDTAESPTAVAELESALATLSITASSVLRRFAGHARPQSRAATHDALGRTRGSLSTGRVAVPAYTRW